MSHTCPLLPTPTLKLISSLGSERQTALPTEWTRGVWETEGEVSRDRAIQGERTRKSYVCLARVQSRN